MNRTVLISGAASGIGLATARKFSLEGWQIVGLDVQPAPPGLGVQHWIRQDLSEPGYLGQILDLVEETGPFNAVILSAGVAGLGEMERVLTINYLSARHLIRALAPRLAEGSAITAVSSAAGWRWLERRPALNSVHEEADDLSALKRALSLCKTPAEAYITSKELLSSLIALECLRQGRNVRLNSVSPGPVETPLIDKFTRSMGEAAMLFSKDVAGRNATPEEVADVILFLHGPGAGWVNGADVRVDGGLTAALASGKAVFPDWDYP